MVTLCAGKVLRDNGLFWQRACLLPDSRHLAWQRPALVTVAAFLAFGIFNSFEALISLVVSFQKAPQICAWANMIGEVEGRLHLYNEKEFKKVARTAGLLTFVYMGFVSFLYLLLTLLIGIGVAICDDIIEVPESIRLMI
ncbi:uncharacterized protein LOC111267833 [Varroa jacobsoni]|uniref:uncharacterized protein LOC111267833 n=1 Tax=Varroa jacobsoni TaxID=62625 RepID=UPI000BF7627E|nr:uncharacterized protein LOC111267833 [Varroa jacobsoni]